MPSTSTLSPAISQDKEIHFNSVGYDNDTIISWDETLYAIENGEKYISTVQMGLLSMDLITAGYRIFVKDWDGEYEIKVGGENERTDRELRIAHNIEKLWKAGEFDLPHPEEVSHSRQPGFC